MGNREISSDLMKIPARGLGGQSEGDGHGACTRAGGLCREGDSWGGEGDNCAFQETPKLRDSSSLLPLVKGRFGKGRRGKGRIYWQNSMGKTNVHWLVSVRGGAK